MENKVKKLNAWGHIKCVNTRKSSEGQRGSHTVNSFGETSRKWVNSMGKLMFIFCELSKEKFFYLPFLAFLLSICESSPFHYPVVLHLCKDQGKILIMTYDSLVYFDLVGFWEG